MKLEITYDNSSLADIASVTALVKDLPGGATPKMAYLQYTNA